MFEWSKVRKSMNLRDLLSLFLNKNIEEAEKLILFAKEKGSEGFLISEFIETENINVSRATIYRIADKLRKIGFLSKSYGRYFISDEFANACKRVYHWWKDFRSK